MRDRWLRLAIGAVLTLFLGLIYAWSLFVTPIEADLGFSRPETSLTFTISMSCFSLGSLLGGILLKKKTPRFTMCLSAVMILAGFVLCSRTALPVHIFLSYGMILSLGVGICYISVMNSVNSWFKDRVGVASGALLMGFGAGGFVLGGLATKLFGLFGWRSTFLIFGIAFAVCILAGSFIMVMPGSDVIWPEPKANAKANAKASKKESYGADMTPAELVRRPSFYIIFLWLMLMLAAGLSVIGNAATFALSLGATAQLAVAATGTMSICNGLGRLMFGSLYDSIGRKTCMLLNSILLMLGMTLLIASSNMESIALMFVAYVCVGLAYGGVPTTNSAITMSFYGAKNYAVNFSIVALCIIPAALLGPYLAGNLYTASGAYVSSFIVMLCVTAVALVTGQLIKKP